MATERRRACENEARQSPNLRRKGKSFTEKMTVQESLLSSQRDGEVIQQQASRHQPHRDLGDCRFAAENAEGEEWSGAGVLEVPREALLVAGGALVPLRHLVHEVQATQGEASSVHGGVVFGRAHGGAQEVAGQLIADQQFEVLCVRRLRDEREPALVIEQHCGEKK